MQKRLSFKNNCLKSKLLDSIRASRSRIGTNIFLNNIFAQTCYKFHRIEVLVELKADNFQFEDANVEQLKQQVCKKTKGYFKTSLQVKVPEPRSFFLSS